LELPADRPRPEVQTYRGGGEVLLLSERLSDAARTFSRKEGVTLYTTMLAISEPAYLIDVRPVSDHSQWDRKAFGLQRLGIAAETAFITPQVSMDNGEGS
jgi:hypothetical protein